MTTLVRVLDAHAVMTFFEGEMGVEHIRGLLLQAVRGELRLAITVVNLGEVYYSIARTNSAEVAEQITHEMAGLPVEVVDVDWYLARQAAQLKAVTPIAYADCFAAALAIQWDCPVVTGDREFRKLEDQVKVEWL